MSINPTFHYPSMSIGRRENKNSSVNFHNIVFIQRLTQQNRMNSTRERIWFFFTIDLINKQILKSKANVNFRLVIKTCTWTLTSTCTTANSICKPISLQL